MKFSHFAFNPNVKAPSVSYSIPVYKRIHRSYVITLTIPGA